MNLENETNSTDSPQMELLEADASATPNRPCEGGRIAVIPRQSAQSCEMVIVALANQLAMVTSILLDEMERHYMDRLDDIVDDDDDEGDPCIEAYDSIVEMLRNLAMDWPHLDLPTV